MVIGTERRFTAGKDMDAKSVLHTKVQPIAIEHQKERERGPSKTQPRSKQKQPAARDEEKGGRVGALMGALSADRRREKKTHRNIWHLILYRAQCHFALLWGPPRARVVYI